MSPPGEWCSANTPRVRVFSRATMSQLVVDLPHFEQYGGLLERQQSVRDGWEWFRMTHADHPSVRCLSPGFNRCVWIRPRPKASITWIRDWPSCPCVSRPPAPSRTPEYVLGGSGETQASPRQDRLAIMWHRHRHIPSTPPPPTHAGWKVPATKMLSVQIVRGVVIQGTFNTAAQARSSMVGAWVTT